MLTNPVYFITWDCHKELLQIIKIAAVCTGSGATVLELLKYSSKKNCLLLFLDLSNVNHLLER